MKDNIVRNKSYQFAVATVRFCRRIKDPSVRPLILQFLKAGTSIGANVEEAIAAQSRPDFLSKMSIASKEAREARYWIHLLIDAEVVDQNELAPLLNIVEDLNKLLSSIVKSTRENNIARDSSNSKFKIPNSKFSSGGLA